MHVQEGLLQIEDCLDANGGIVLPPGVTLISLIDRNIANVGDAVAYRYLEFARSADGQPVQLTWSQLGRRMQAIGARVERRLMPIRPATPGGARRKARRCVLMSVDVG